MAYHPAVASSAAIGASLTSMASREKTTSPSRASQPRADKAGVSQAQPPRAGATREAVREIVRRYSETFERLGR